MKNNLLATVLTVALALSGVMAALLVLQYNHYTKRFSELQARVTEINTARNTLQALANDALTYSQRNPALLPVLQQFGLINAPAAPAASSAAPKTAPAKTAPKTSTTKK